MAERRARRPSSRTHRRHEHSFIQARTVDSIVALDCACGKRVLKSGGFEGRTLMVPGTGGSIANTLRGFSDAHAVGTDVRTVMAELVRQGATNWRP